MNVPFIIANWKSNKTNAEAIEWLQEFANPQNKVIVEKKEVILCPPFTLLSDIKKILYEQNILIKLGSQNISMSKLGAFTGEIPGELLKDYVEYAIIGHSERRTLMSETDEMIVKKVEMALQNNITPILCVQNDQTLIPQGIEIVAYEPTFAIGSGMPETPENAEKVASRIKSKGIKYVLYGGSVNEKNIHAFTSKPNIDGVLVGSASLDASVFSQMCNNA